MKINKVLGLAFTLIGAGVMVWAGLAGWQEQIHPVTPTPLWQVEPLVPTAPPPSPSRLSQTQPTAALIPTPTPVNTPLPAQPRPAEPLASTVSPATPVVSQTVQPLPTLPPTPLPPTAEAEPPSRPTSSNALKRFGIGAPYLPPLEAEAARELGLGWYLTWSVLENPPGPAGVEFWQMIRLAEDGFRPDEKTIRRVARTRPGATWLIGNEPDVKWQDDVPPARYAELYHHLYDLLKKADPTCRVAIGGVAQPTPLRLQYLDMVLSSYQDRYGQPMPVDVWNIHNFILREERDSWGVEIPPGLAVDRGILFELDDHDDLERFKAQIIGFRQWMARRGQRHKPLIVSEYGILMPEDYGFPLEGVKSFMYGTYDFMLNATDEQIGYPVDDNRLVQRWAWYSLSDDRYPTGNFIDLETGQLTDLGRAHQAYIANLP